VSEKSTSSLEHRESSSGVLDEPELQETSDDVDGFGSESGGRPTLREGIEENHRRRNTDGDGVPVSDGEPVPSPGLAHRREAQFTQNVAYGRTSSRAVGMSWPQDSHTPYSPLSIRSRACSTLWSRSMAFCCIDSSFSYSNFIEPASALPGSGLRSADASVWRACSRAWAASSINSVRRWRSSSSRVRYFSSVDWAGLRAIKPPFGREDDSKRP